MQQAADDLRFETAARIKSFIQQLSRLGKGSFRHAAEIADFQFLCFQRGPKSPQAHIFLITPGKIEHIMSLLDESFKPADVMRSALSSAAVSPLTADGVERIGIIAHHLFSPKHSHGVFLRLNQVDEKSIARAYREIQKQAPLETIEDEGVMKELQSL
jgi:hypothetical protein